MNRNTLLIADDAVINREMLKDIFEGRFNILEAANGQEAINLLDKNYDKIALLFLDLIMPEKSGLDVMMHMSINGMMNQIPVIMITGDNTVENAVKAYELGVSDFIKKPFEPEIVIHRTQNLIELFKSRMAIEKELEDRTKEVFESKKKLEESNMFLLNALGSVVEFRSLESGEHIQRVRKFTRIILKYIQIFCDEYHITDEQIKLIEDAAALHDVGKIAIPDRILMKPGKLTPEEYEEMKKHTIYGCEILEKFKQDSSEFYNYCYDICRFHHERYDGKGYPDGLVGEQIPIWAQVVSIADVYDALVSKRVYKESISIDDAFKMIEGGECGTFSPKILQCFEAAKSELISAI